MSHSALVMSSTRRTDTFLHRALPSPIVLDDGGLGGLPAPLGRLQRDLASLGLQTAIVAAGAPIPSRRRALIVPSVASPIRLRFRIASNVSSTEGRAKSYGKVPNGEVDRLTDGPLADRKVKTPNRLPRVTGTTSCNSEEENTRAPPATGR